MAIIDVETPQGIVKVEIAGDTPTEEETNAIRAQFFSAPDKTEQTFEDLLAQSRKATPQGQVVQSNFDTESGIQDAGLRSALSLAENKAEEEAILSKQGFSTEDYIRDNRGRLALTPSGAAKVGVQTDKNVLIDEEGFSRNDLSDLAGILPELAGGVTGAIKGATIGTGFAPGFGTLLGGAVGAFVGGGGGSLVEEAIEGVAGVSKQTAGDIAQDAAIEGGIAAAGELLFGIPILAYRAVAPSGAKFIREASEEELKITAKGIEKGLEPTIAQIKGRPIAAKFQQLQESVLGGSPRTQKIAAAMDREVAELNKFVSQAATEGSEKSAGDLFLDFEQKFGKELAKKQTAAYGSIMNALKESADNLAGGLERNQLIDDNIFNFVQQSAKNFEDTMSQQWATINEVIETAIGDTRILPTSTIKEVADLAEKKFAQAGTGDLATAEGQLGLKLASDLRALGDKSSFTDAYQLRRKLWDLKNAPKTAQEVEQKAIIDSSVNLTQVWDDAIKKVDRLLDSSNIDSLTKEITDQLGSEAFGKMQKAAALLPTARKQFREGTALYNDISRTLGSKELVEQMRSGGFNINRPGALTGLTERVIGTGGKPTGLNRLKKAFKNQPDQYTQIKTQMGREWLQGALNKTGFDSIKPNNFKPNEFIKALDDLGETGVELYGRQRYNQLKTFAKQFEDLKLTNIDSDTVSTLVKQGLDADGNVATALNNSIDQLKETSRLRTNSVFAKIRNNNLDAEEALDLVMSPGATRGDIKAVMNFYKDKPAELKTIRGAYVENMLDNIGAVTNADGMKQLAKNIRRADKSNKLDIVFPNAGDTKDVAVNIRDFGKILERISANIPKGDLVAAGILANVFNNVGRIAKMFVLGQLFTGKKAMKEIVEASKKLEKNPSPTVADQRAFLESVSNAFRPGQVITQSIEENVSDASDQIQSVAENTGINQAVRNVGANTTNQLQGIQAVNPNTNVGKIDVTSPGTGAALGLSPIDQAIAARRGSPLTVPKEQYGSLFNQ
tara:strand:- start:2178 stop:5216 length:3039 start_codon:yes stop_codon:yes gene_type:complete